MQGRHPNQRGANDREKRNVGHEHKPKIGRNLADIRRVAGWPCLDWQAIDTLRQQSDKSWRISACVVVPNEGRATSATEHFTIFKIANYAAFTGTYGTFTR